MFNTKYYSHQYFSIIVLAFVGLGKFIIYFYNKGFGYFFLHLLIHLAYSFFKSLSTVYMKGLMEYKYITPYKACYVMGMFNLFIITIVYIIVTFYPCDNTFCKVEYNNKKYFGNVKTILNLPSLLTLVNILIKTIQLVLAYIVINDYSVCHSFLIVQKFSVVEFGLFSDDLILFFQILGEILTIISVFFIALFLEIIQINICKLNYDVKKNIEKRAAEDLLVITNDENSLDEEDI